MARSFARQSFDFDRKFDDDDDDDFNIDSDPSEYGGYSSYGEDSPTPQPLSAAVDNNGLSFPSFTARIRQNGTAVEAQHDSAEGKEVDAFLETYGDSDSEAEDEAGDGKGAGFTIPNGWQLRETFSRQGRSSDIIDAIYNATKNVFAIVDKKGVSLWDPTANAVVARHDFPAYQHQMYSHIVAVESYNVYIVYSKDLTLRVLNKDLVELSCTRCENRSVLSLLFNEERSELVTGSVGGFTIWSYAKNHKSNLPDSIGVLKARHNYVLTAMRHIELTPDSWVTGLRLEDPKGTPITGGGPRLVVMVGGDALFYDAKTYTQVFVMRALHEFPITACLFFPAESCYLTTSRDSKVRVWNERGVKVKTFHSHTRDVTSALAHPTSPSLAITSSLDGSIRMWHVGTLTEMYAVQLPGSPLLKLGHKDAGNFFCAGKRELHIWGLNHVMELWALARAPARVLRRERCEGKSTRLLVACDDGSARLLSKTGRPVTTLLPPPTASPNGQVEGIAYSRQARVMFVLIDNGATSGNGGEVRGVEGGEGVGNNGSGKGAASSQEIWVYTARTDPCCRVDVWAGEALRGVNPVCLASYTGPLVLTGRPGGDVCPDAYDYLLVGTRRGHVLFYDTGAKAVRHHELKADKDPIVSIEYHVQSNTLVTCALGLDAVIALWALPTLTPCGMVRCALNITCLTRLGSLFMTGHADGTIQILESSQLHKSRVGALTSQRATTRACSDAHGGTNRSATPTAGDRTNERSKSSLMSFVGTTARDNVQGAGIPSAAGQAVSVRQASTGGGSSFGAQAVADPGAAATDHAGPVFSVDCVESMRLFCSAGGDGLVRIWDEWKNLLREIAINPSLRCASFLSYTGDIVLSADDHLYIVHPEIYLPSNFATHSPAPGRDDDVVSNAGSETFEDFEVYDGSLTGAGMTLRDYLVPYSMELQQQWYVEGKAPPAREEVEPEVAETIGEASAAMSTVDEQTELNLSRATSVSSIRSVSTTASSRAPTEIYSSEPPSPGARPDVLDGDFAWDDHLPMLLGTPTEVRSECGSSCASSPHVMSEASSDEEEASRPPPEPAAAASALRKTTSNVPTVSFASMEHATSDHEADEEVRKGSASLTRRLSNARRNSVSGRRKSVSLKSSSRQSMTPSPAENGGLADSPGKRHSAKGAKNVPLASASSNALRRTTSGTKASTGAVTSSRTSLGPSPGSESLVGGHNKGASPQPHDAPISPLFAGDRQPLATAPPAVPPPADAARASSPGMLSAGSSMSSLGDLSASQLSSSVKARRASSVGGSPSRSSLSTAALSGAGRLSIVPVDDAALSGHADAIARSRASSVSALAASAPPRQSESAVPSGNSPDARRTSLVRVDTSKRSSREGEQRKHSEAKEAKEEKKRKKKKKKRAHDEDDATLSKAISALGIFAIPTDDRAQSAPASRQRTTRDPPRPHSSYYRPAPATTHNPQIIVPNEYLRADWDDCVLQRDAEKREKQRERIIAAAERRMASSRGSPMGCESMLGAPRTSQATPLPPPSPLPPNGRASALHTPLRPATVLGTYGDDRADTGRGGELQPLRASTPTSNSPALDDGLDSPPAHFKMGLIFSVVLPYRHRISDFPSFPPEVEGLREGVAKSLFRGAASSSSSVSSLANGRPASARNSTASLAVVSSAAVAAASHLGRTQPPSRARGSPIVRGHASPPSPTQAQSPQPHGRGSAPAVPNGGELVLLIDRLGEQHVKTIARQLVRDVRPTTALRHGHLLPLMGARGAVDTAEHVASTGPRGALAPN